MNDARPVTDDCSVRDAAAVPEQGDVAGPGRSIHADSVCLDRLQEPLLAAVKRPVLRVRLDLDVGDHTALLEHGREKLPAVDAVPLHAGLVVPWRPEPGAGLVDDGEALDVLVVVGDHRMLSGFGTFGVPPNRSWFANRPVHTVSDLSHPNRICTFGCTGPAS